MNLFGLVVASSCLTVAVLTSSETRYFLDVNKTTDFKIPLEKSTNLDEGQIF